jgi:hypothetical protein
MGIKFAITKSKLLNNPTGYAARVQSVGTVDFDALVDEVANCNTSVTKSDVLSVLEDYHTIIEKLVRQGFIVLTPHVRYRTSVRGTFLDEGDAFDPALHRVLVRVSPGTRLRQALRDVPVEKVRAAPPRPWPETYIDGTSGERNGAVTPGGPGRLVGTNLQFDPTDPQQGVFFVDAAKVETRVEAVVWDMPGHLIFTVPALAAGEYALHVRAILRGTHDMRAGVLDAVLTVA